MIWSWRTEWASLLSSSALVFNSLTMAIMAAPSMALTPKERERLHVELLIQPRVLDGQDRLGGEGLEQLHDIG